MNPLHDVAHDLISGFLPFAAALVATAVITLAVALIITSSVPRLSAGSRVSILIAALVIPLLIAVLQLAGVTPSLVEPAAPAGPATAIAYTVSTDTTLPATAHQSSPLDWSCLLAFLWGAGFLFGSARLAVQAARWRRLAADTVPIDDTSVRQTFGELARRTGVTAELVESRSCREPVVIGIRRPRILLPSTILEQVDPESLEAILAHELGHVARRDNLTGTLLAFIRSLFWIDPLHHFALRRYLVMRERACDERALESGCAPRNLVDALNVCCNLTAPTPAAACMSSAQIPERIESIMTHADRRHHHISSRRVRIAVLVATGIVATAAALSIQPPVIASPLVSEEARPPASEPRVTAFAESAMGSDPEMIRIAIDVRDAGGTVVFTPTIQTKAGVPFEVVSGGAVTPGGPTITVRGEVDASHRGRIEVTWTREGKELRSESAPIIPLTRRVVPSTSPSHPPEPAITLAIQNADLHDLLKMVSNLTGKAITADPGINGRVSIDVVDTPWTLALFKALEPLNLTILRSPDGTSVRVIQRVEPPPPPPGVHRVGGDVSPPRPLTRVEPIYPPEARRARVAGMVILEMVINERGEVENARVLKPMPFGMDQAALDAVRQWKFEPATIDGTPVKVLFNITISFRPSEEPASDQGLTVVPAKIAGPDPIYPREARAAGAQGTVTLLVSISAEGAVTDVAVSSGVSPELDAAAVAAVRQWVFSPGQRDGIAVASKHVVTIPFVND
jgi:TonB family protein